MTTCLTLFCALAALVSAFFFAHFETECLCGVGSSLVGKFTSQLPNRLTRTHGLSE